MTAGRAPPKLAPGATRWKCICAYDGGPFGGWQSQPDGNSIQDVIEGRLEEIFDRRIRIVELRSERVEQAMQQGISRPSGVDVRK